MKRTTCLWLVFLVGVMLVGFPANGESQKRIIAGDDHEIPPFAFLDQDEKPTGFSIELMQALGQVLGWELEIELGSWAEIKESLSNGEIDVIAGMFYTPSRAEQFSFTTKHSVASGDIFSRSDTRVQSLDDLRDQRVVVQRGDVIHEYLMEQDLNLDLVPVSNVADALRLVASGEEDYAAVLLIPGHYAIQQYQLSNVDSNKLQMAAFDYCVAVQKDNTAMQLMLDEALRIVKATGKYDEIYAKWLGVYEEKPVLNWKTNTRALMVSLGISAIIFAWALILHYMVRLRTADLTRANTRLSRSREDLSYANDELRSTIQQLTATSNQLATQYEQLQLMEEELSEEKDLLRTTLLSVGEGIVVTNRRGEVVMINHVAEKLTGWINQSAVGRLYREIFPGDHGQIVEDVIYTEKIVEIDEQHLVSVGGDAIIVASTVAPIQDASGVVRGAVVVFRDISESVRQRAEIEYLSYHDPLTGLFNRRAFSRELERCDELSKLPLAIIVADVNGLKLINDAFGHVYGDELLVKVARILDTGGPSSGVVARLGGDEFAVLLPRTGRTEAQDIVQNFKSLAQQQTVQSIQISIAFGVAVKESGNQNLQDVLNLAEERMYRDKMLENAGGASVDFVINTLFEKSSVEKEHSQRVAQLAQALGKALGLAKNEVSELHTIGLLHDIGKISVEDQVIHKEGALTPEEWDNMKRHPELGYRILRGAKDMEEIARTILAHHERFDGEGYPKRLTGSEIPFQARIIAIVDAYDAMTRKAIYKPALTPKQAVLELRAQAGTQFDPELVEVFIQKVLPQLEEERVNSNDEKIVDK